MNRPPLVGWIRSEAPQDRPPLPPGPPPTRRPLPPSGTSRCRPALCPPQRTCRPEPRPERQVKATRALTCRSRRRLRRRGSGRSPAGLAVSPLSPPRRRCRRLLLVVRPPRPRGAGFGAEPRRVRSLAAVATRASLPAPAGGCAPPRPRGAGFGAEPRRVGAWPSPPAPPYRERPRFVWWCVVVGGVGVVFVGGGAGVGWWGWWLLVVVVVVSVRGGRRGLGGLRVGVVAGVLGELTDMVGVVAEPVAGVVEGDPDRGAVGGEVGCGVQG